ncbi:low quality protein: [Lynx pardinus]|uniref:Low quality protein n=1 Tax=Lynx pardinus TaxID=191816 RepID=A0A485PML0_LYNPA|nr:low quality protein: [Lynx pardinus]
MGTGAHLQHHCIVHSLDTSLGLPVTWAPLALRSGEQTTAVERSPEALTLLTPHVALCSRQRLMSVNYLGSVYPSRAVITTMKERRVGRIVFVSSQAGQLGLFGFTAYSSSKFAIRGLAEALQMEVKPYNVYVTVAYPPDTDTPGFAEENKTKPLETRLISETVSVCKPEQVAKQIVKDAIQGNFNSSIGSDGYMLSSLTCGMAPVTSITEGLQQVVTMGLFRTIALFYLGSFDSIVRRCMMQRAKSEVADKTA